MQFVQPSVELIDEQDNFKRIERCGRICYKSENKTTDDSAFPFFQRMVKNGHTSVLEHSVIYVRTHNPETYLWLVALLDSYSSETGYPHYIKYSKWMDDENSDTIFTPSHRDSGLPLGYCTGSEHLFSGNIRAWRSICSRFSGESILYDTFCNHPAFKDIFDNIPFKSLESDYTQEDIEIVDSIPIGPNEFKYAYLHYPVTLHFVGDRGVIDEFLRHRVMSPSVESTRYCNYQNGGVTFVFPYWFDSLKDDPKFASFGGDFGNRCYDTEVAYQNWMNKCNIPQMARGNLTLWIKSEMAMTGTIQYWIDFLKLRDSKAAHPEAQKLAKMVEKVLVEDVGVEDMWGVKENA